MLQKPLNRADFTDEELEKCEKDRLYFYNKYVRPDGAPELSQAEYDEYVKKIEIIRNGGVFLKPRRTGNGADAYVINSIVSPLYSFFYKTEFEKSMLSGRPFDYTLLNIFLYGKMDPDAPDYTPEQLKELYKMAYPNLNSTRGKVSISSTAMTSGKGFKKIWDNAEKRPLEDVPTDKLLLKVRRGGNLASQELLFRAAYPLTPDEAFKKDEDGNNQISNQIQE